MTTSRNQEALLTDLPIVGYYDKQRFVQFNPTDCANWVLMPSDLGKKKVAMYPAMGRRHVRFLNHNQLIFESEPREIFTSVTYSYYVVNDLIYRVDEFFNRVEITNNLVQTVKGDMYFDYLVVGTKTYVGFTDLQQMYIYEETSGTFGIVTDPNRPVNPQFIVAFGNRFVVSDLNSSQFNLTEVNLTAGTFSYNTVFTIAGSAVFAQEVGIIKQMLVYQNTLYIFSAFKTGLWSNRPSTFISAGGTPSSFPFQRNTTVEFDSGMSDPKSLDTGFDRACWVSRNKKGQYQTVALVGGNPTRINTKAIDVLFQRTEDADEAISPFITERLSGFLYEYENTVFYRLSTGNYIDDEFTDSSINSNSIEFNFDVEQWSRCIEKNGQRNRAQRHIYFNGRNLVSIQGESTVYEFSGRIYSNEIRNKLQKNPQADNAYIPEPFRYVKVTPIITIKNINDIGYAEFSTEYVDIDFAYGLYSSRFLNAPLQNAVFIVDESSDSNNSSIYLVAENTDNEFLITENSNLPVLSDQTYYNWFKPHVELLYSDDGGISYTSADVQLFSDVGIYQWRMRWYNLGSSRNRCYKLICVSSSPIVVLGGTMKIKRMSSGAD